MRVFWQFSHKKTILPEVYKLTSLNPCNKNKVKIHKDSGIDGIEFTVDKTIPDFNKGADKVELNYASAFIKFERPRSMFLRNTLQNQSMTQQALYCQSPTETLRKVSRVLSSSSFSVVRMRRTFEIGSWSTISLVAISRFERTLEHQQLSIAIAAMSYSV